MTAMSACGAVAAASGRRMRWRQASAQSSPGAAAVVRAPPKLRGTLVTQGMMGECGRLKSTRKPFDDCSPRWTGDPSDVRSLRSPVDVVIETDRVLARRCVLPDRSAPVRQFADGRIRRAVERGGPWRTPPCRATHRRGPAPAALEPGWAAPIMTGAPMPVGADAIIPIEDAIPDRFQSDAGRPRLAFAATVAAGASFAAAGATACGR